MKNVQVTYTTKAEFALQNQKNIQAVMADLQKLGHQNLFYHACMKPDGKTFVHTAFFVSDADQQVLFDLPAFKHFQQELKASGLEIPPQQEMLHLIGVSRHIF